MKIGILGTGVVGRTLGLKLVQLGHSVKLGTRDPSKLDEPKGHGANAPTLADWLEEAGPVATIGTFGDAAAYGEIVVNAVSGSASLDVLLSVGEVHLGEKTLVDIANPIEQGRAFSTLFLSDTDSLFVKDSDSLGERLQRALPDVRVVKTLNTMLAPLMVNPNLVGDGDHTVFVSGNDISAKAEVTSLLREIGWRDILDLGDITSARGAEMMMAMGLAVIRAHSPSLTAFKVMR